MDEGLSEHELEELLRERRENIESKFAEDCPDPPSFMRQVPFENHKTKRLAKRQATIDDRQREDSPGSAFHSEGRLSRSRSTILESHRPSLISTAIDGTLTQHDQSLARQSSVQFSGSNTGSGPSPVAGLHGTLTSSMHFKSVDALTGTLGGDTSEQHRATVEAAWAAALEAANNGTMVLPGGQSTVGGRRRQSLMSNSSEGAAAEESAVGDLKKKSEVASRASQITLPPVPRGSRKEAQASAGVRDALKALRAAALSEYSTTTPAY